MLAPAQNQRQQSDLAIRGKGMISLKGRQTGPNGRTTNDMAAQYREVIFG